MIISYEYHQLMNGQIKVLMMGLQIELDEKVIHALLAVLMDQVQGILI